MAPDPYRPMSGISSNGSRGWTPPDTSYLRMQLDNLLRRELKVADPSDARQVATALLNRYQGTPRAQAIAQEASGLPSVPVPAAAPTAPVVQTTAGAELQEALDDVERDLRELLTNAAFKDVTPEISGWAQAIRAICQEGANAARFGLDPRQRDKAMAIRRQLGDFARVARIIGALTPNMGVSYRSLARSLDEVSAVMLVMVGEALASVGMNGGQFLLQVPFSELQVRRDAAVYALRNLNGATQEAFGPEDWPRGINAYRQMFEILESGGHPDLRSLLVEQELVRSMDSLIELAGQGGSDGLRALGATAQLVLPRFYRLVWIGQSAVDPESPPLTAFLEALRLFADAFTAAGGYRLLRIARPPILFYGLYERNGTDAAEARLMRLLVRRGELADKLDCFLACECTPAAKQWQIAFDMVLYQIDRAVDLYAFGTEPFGGPERRAAAYGFVIQSLKDYSGRHPVGSALQPTVDSVLNSCTRLRDEGLWPDGGEPLALEPDTIRALGDYTDAVAAELHFLSTQDLHHLVRHLPVDPNDLPSNPDKNDMVHALRRYFEKRRRSLHRATFTDVAELYNELEDVQSRLERLGRVVPTVSDVEDLIGVMHDELCLQIQVEKNWRALVRQMAPGCIDFDQITGFLSRIVSDGLDKLGSRACPTIKTTIPPSIETSLDGFVNAVDRRGRYR